MSRCGGWVGGTQRGCAGGGGGAGPNVVCGVWVARGWPFISLGGGGGRGLAGGRED